MTAQLCPRTPRRRLPTPPPPGGSWRLSPQFTHRRLQFVAAALCETTLAAAILFVWPSDPPSPPLAIGSGSVFTLQCERFEPEARTIASSGTSRYGPYPRPFECDVTPGWERVRVTHWGQRYRILWTRSEHQFVELLTTQSAGRVSRRSLKIPTSVPREAGTLLSEGSAQVTVPAGTFDCESACGEALPTGELPTFAASATSERFAGDHIPTPRTGDVAHAPASSAEAEEKPPPSMIFASLTPWTCQSRPRGSWCPWTLPKSAWVSAPAGPGA